MDKVDHFDVCIIGASIAGNYLSYLLSQSSLKIAVIEEHEEVGSPFQCAGIVSMKLAKLIDLPEDLILNRVDTAKLTFPSGESVELAGNERPYVIDRVKLDRLFYEKVRISNNITFFLGEKFKSFEYLKGGYPPFLQINTSKRTIKTSLLVGCDGPLSSVGKQLGVTNNVIYATQIRARTNFDINKAYMHFDERWNELFGWIVPEGNGICRIGLGCSKNLMEKFKLFLNKIGVSYEHRIDQQGGIIPINSLNKMAFDNVLLLGDSASMVKATTGGGIVMLLIAAKYAANCICKAFQTKNFSKGFLKEHYEAPCSASIERQLKLHQTIRYLLQNFSNNDFKAFYRILTLEEIKNVISIYGDMDFPVRVALKLLTKPNFLKFLVKFTIKNPLIVCKSLFLLLN